MAEIMQSLGDVWNNFPPGIDEWISIFVLFITLSIAFSINRFVGFVVAISIFSYWMTGEFRAVIAALICSYATYTTYQPPEAPPASAQS